MLTNAREILESYAIPLMDHYLNEPTRMAALAIRGAVGEEPMLIKADRVVGPGVKTGIKAAGALTGESAVENSSGEPKLRPSKKNQ